MKKRREDYDRLSRQRIELLEEKKKALALNKELLLQVNGESDPAWIELILMQKLGLAPEDQKKIFFK